jgi:hypothetical protein
MLMESEHSMAREDRDGSGIEIEFMTMSPEAEFGVGGKTPRVIVDKGLQGDRKRQCPTGQIVVRYGTVRTIDATYDSLSALTSRLRPGGERPSGAGRQVVHLLARGRLALATRHQGSPDGYFFQCVTIWNLADGGGRSGVLHGLSSTPGDKQYWLPLKEGNTSTKSFTLDSLTSWKSNITEVIEI